MQTYTLRLFFFGFSIAGNMLVYLWYSSKMDATRSAIATQAIIPLLF
jgi:hypothetical protein